MAEPAPEAQEEIGGPGAAAGADDKQVDIVPGWRIERRQGSGDGCGPEEWDALQGDEPPECDLQLLPRFCFAVEPALAVLTAAFQKVEVAVAFDDAGERPLAVQPFLRLVD